MIIVFIVEGHSIPSTVGQLNNRVAFTSVEYEIMLYSIFGSVNHIVDYRLRNLIYREIDYNFANRNLVSLYFRSQNPAPS